MNIKKIAFIAFAQVAACGAAIAASAEEQAGIDFGIEDQTDAYVLETVTPKYPVEMLQRGIQGSTLLMLRVDEQGEVSDVRVLSSSSPAFSKSAIKSVKNWYFQPGTKNGRAVAQTVTVPVDFLIDDLQMPALASR
ncbi:energy transducer TonB [Pelagicoccus albus]|uniref:Energy transducer TonB n=1 Tax=Pelagicoccus albus TaxID=415222 RepID=A0A7X1E8A6_9BACT|nr:energy transducer TonB [Pelagicoccus albus]MBC2604582.1 energy transducer TonB [Pelagicoccus albus]